MWGLILSAVTIGASILTDKEGGGKQPSRSSQLDLWRGGNDPFLSGARKFQISVSSESFFSFCIRTD